MDVSGANDRSVIQRIVHDDEDEWSATDLNLLQIGAPPHSVLLGSRGLLRDWWPMAEIRNCSTSDQLPDEEVAQRMDRAVLRMMANAAAANSDKSCRDQAAEVRKR